MKCRNCGIDIADKALICYRCGTATSEAKYKPAALPRRSSSSLIVTILLVAVLVAAGVFVDRVTTVDATQLTARILIAVSIVIVAVRAYLRRR